MFGRFKKKILEFEMYCNIQTCFKKSCHFVLSITKLHLLKKLNGLIIAIALPNLKSVDLNINRASECISSDKTVLFSVASSSPYRLYKLGQRVPEHKLETR